ncbi:hypothetical protein Hypma_006033, partial [Hypsizygus marmoreus]
MSSSYDIKKLTSASHRGLYILYSTDCSRFACHSSTREPRLSRLKTSSRPTPQLFHKVTSEAGAVYSA